MPIEDLIAKLSISYDGSDVDRGVSKLESDLNKLQGTAEKLGTTKKVCNKSSNKNKLKQI